MSSKKPHRPTNPAPPAPSAPGKPTPAPLTLEQRRDNLLHTIEQIKAQLYGAQGALSLVNEMIARQEEGQAKG